MQSCALIIEDDVIDALVIVDDEDMFDLSPGQNGYENLPGVVFNNYFSQLVFQPMLA